MILDDRPHRLQYQVSTGGYEDDNGDYHPGTTEFVGDIPCRNVPSGKTEEKEFEDGVIRTYSSVVRLDADCREFFIGERVKLLLHGEVTREHEVKGFQRYQKCARLWL